MTTRETYSKEEYERLERDIVGHSTISPSEASVLRAALRIASLRDEIVAALKPFAELGNALNKSGPDDWQDDVSARFLNLEVRDFRKIAAIVSKLTGE